MNNQIERPETVDPTDLVTVANLASEASQAFNEQKLRWMIFNSERNGLAPALIRINNRVFIHRPTFCKWLALGSQNKRTAA